MFRVGCYLGTLHHFPGNLARTNLIKRDAQNKAAFHLRNCVSSYCMTCLKELGSNRGPLLKGRNMIEVLMSLPKCSLRLDGRKEKAT